MAVDWESGELSEGEEGQLEVIHALAPSARDAAELLSISSLRRFGLLYPIWKGCTDTLCCVAMGINRNDLKAQQLLEKFLKKGARLSPPARSKNEAVEPDRGKKAIVRGGGATDVEEAEDRGGQEGAIVPSSTTHSKRMKDFLDTTRLVLSGEMSWQGLVGNESTYATSTAMAFKQSVRGRSDRLLPLSSARHNNKR
ncbi:unnamed protein product [Prunus armeniaca]|uniref:Uncharacterized protein n=1 Tax=Prunus armeniaca TaxID=36596 RepID=A0A6J5XYV7_PRUAR|nr:unnamed protein product [Prunus armeniaca]